MIHLGGSYILRGLAKAAICSVIMGAVMYAVLGLSRHVSAATSDAAVIARVAATGLAGVTAFILSALLLKLEEPRKVMGLFYGSR